MSLSAFRRIVFAAACAGLAAGLVLTALQAARVAPLIAAAETFEAGAGDRSGDHGGGAHAHADGAGRLSLTLLANVLAGVAFALPLVAALSLAPPADWRRGLVWGGAGFVAFSLAPAAGLPPGLPGAAAADLGARQLWWAGCAAATAAGLALAVFGPALWARVCGAALALAPHAVGAPRPVGHEAHGGLPAELAAAFVGASLAASFVFWLVAGGVGAWAFSRLEADRSEAAAPGR